MVASVVVAGDTRLRWRPSDRLWLLRSVEAEGPSRTLVAQALVNRWAFLAKRGDRRGLGELVRAYSQPVNPRWVPGGDLYQRALEAADTPGARAELARRVERRRRAMSATKFRAATVAAVARALEQGPLDLPPGTVHFDDGRRARPTLERTAGRTGSGNVFYAVPGARFLYSVAPQGRSWRPAGVALGVLGSAALWWALRRRWA